MPLDLSDATWLNGLSGKLDAAGHVLLLFWSPSSVPCLQALRVLEELLPRYDRRITLIGVYCPRFPRERKAESARDAIARLEIYQPFVHDPDGRVRHHFGIDRLPTLVVLGPDGQSLRLPGEPDLRRTRELLDRLLSAAAEAGGTGPVRILRPAGERQAERIPSAPGALRFPSAIKAMQGAATHPRWVVSDCGHHQIVLLDDYGRERIRFGSGAPGLMDGARDTAQFRSPQGLVCGADTVFVADTGNHVLRRIDVTDGRIVTIAGTGQRGGLLPGDAMEGCSTALASPWDLELDGDNLYFSNAGSNQIGVYNCVEGTVTLLAGTGERGTGDGPAQRATFAQPCGLAIEDAGDRLFVADSDSGLLRSLSLDEQPVVTTLYGPGSGRTSFTGKLQFPLGLAWAEGELLVADSYNDRLLAIPVDGQGIVEPGGERWRQHLPPLSEPSGVCADDLQRLLIVDRNNHCIIHYAADAADPQRWPIPER
jgi:thiol-disulfide isomerase/thioredoxin